MTKNKIRAIAFTGWMVSAATMATILTVLESI